MTTQTFTPRFIPQHHMKELYELYQIARAAGHSSRYDRLIYASKEFNKSHPEFSTGHAYKDISDAVAWND